ncbi:MAG: hypothetical protein R6V04_01240, partial [bacterium]
MKYLKQAQNIFYWLKDLQVKQREIIGEIADDNILFVLEHPVEGKINIEISYPDSEYFTVKGINLRLWKRKKEKVFISVYDYGAIFD